MLLVSTMATAQFSIKGKVTNTKDKPVAGAEVYIRQSQNLVITDVAGEFVFENVPAGKYDIVVFAFQYQIYEQEINYSEDLQLNIPIKSVGC